MTLLFNPEVQVRQLHWWEGLFAAPLCSRDVIVLIGRPPSSSLSSVDALGGSSRGLDIDGSAEQTSPPLTGATLLVRKGEAAQGVTAG